MINKIAPCKGCEDRRAGCHAECEKYKEWKTESDRNRELIKEHKLKEYEITGVEIQRFKKRRRKIKKV